MTVKVNVTQEHIKDGIRGMCVRCPIALAIKDQLPGLKYVSVWGDCININRMDGSRWLAKTPEVAYLFIDEFDRGKPVQPFKFQLKFKELSK